MKYKAILQLIKECEKRKLITVTRKDTHTLIKIKHITPAKKKPQSFDTQRVRDLIETYCKAKNITDAQLKTSQYKVFYKTAQEIHKAVGDKAPQIIEQASAYYDNKGWSWTLHTILKNLPIIIQNHREEHRNEL